MASDLKLLNVVAFDAAGRAVIASFKNWKLSYQARQASLEIKYETYSKTYDLRTQVLLAATGDSEKKVSIGKTLGRVALTGLLHGRHAASADLRWGGVDRDEYHTLVMVLDDTTRVSMQMSNDEVKELWELLPDAAKEDAADERTEKMMLRIKAMVADGERVLDELQAKRSGLEAEFKDQHLKIEGAASFDERHDARQRCAAITQQLNELSTVQRAVHYDFAVLKHVEVLKLANAAPSKPGVVAAKPMQMAAAVATSAPAPMTAPSATMPPVKAQAAPERPATKNKTSLMGKVVKLLVWLLGAAAGFIFTAIVGLFIGTGGAWFLLFVFVPLGGWLALKMLAALMRR